VRRQYCRNSRNRRLKWWVLGSWLEFGSILVSQTHFKGALKNYTTARKPPTGRSIILFIDGNIAAALLANGRFSKTIAEARLVIAEFPIAAESANGQDAEAHANLQKFLAAARTLGTMAKIQKVPYFAANSKLPLRPTPPRDARGVAAPARCSNKRQT